jgi:hypothetical protein
MLSVAEILKIMKVFKITIENYFHAIYAENIDDALMFLSEEIGNFDYSEIQEIPESEWDRKNIKIYEDNDTSKEPFYVSIREEIIGNETQLVYTNDFSTFN